MLHTGWFQGWQRCRVQRHQGLTAAMVTELQGCKLRDGLHAVSPLWYAGAVTGWRFGTPGQ